jgi:tRNA A37 threonylcarbamoyladenosine dehydratase
MSLQLISRSADLARLKDEGYEIEVTAGHLILHNVPYVNSQKEVKRGALASELTLAGDATTKPATHVVMFAGEYPCDKDGRPLEKIRNASGRKRLFDGFYIDHLFSSKPPGGYTDYHHQMATYAAILESAAEAIDPNATAKTRRVIENGDPASVFHYIDTASARAGIVVLTKKLELARVAIIGLGGTGSYVLDMVAKTPVKEIHLFDKDLFLQHNAFRTPGAPSVEELRATPLKVNYLKNIYARMRGGIVAHESSVDGSNVDLLRHMDFVFVCVDSGLAKRPIIESLEGFGVPFVDVGMGLELVDDQLLGVLRVTTSTKDKRDHVRANGRIAFVGNGQDDVYSKNIQIAELNALNAALAVIKWKKLFGFYLDLEREHFSAYTLDGNVLTNEDQT